MKQERWRWVVLGVAMLSTMCQGVSYTPSVFKNEVLSFFAARGAPTDSRQWMLAVSMGFVLLPLGMWLGGLLADKGRVGLALGIGALMTGLGLSVAGLSTSIGWFVLGFGALLSIGCGFSYGTCVGTAVRWFPDRRGLAAGLTVAALGLGGMILVKLQQLFLARAAELGWSPMTLFFAMGATFFVVIGLAALIVRNPPEGYAPAGWTPPAATAARGTATMSPGEAIRTRRFWLLFAVYFLGTFPGMLLVPELRQVVAYIGDPLSVGLVLRRSDAALALGALAVSLWGFANAAGRIGWGWLSDRWGRPNTMKAVYLVGAWAMAMLAALASISQDWNGAGNDARGHAAIALVVLVAVCFGGILGLFPALNAEAFGTRHAAKNYAALFVAFSLSALIAPQMGAFFRLPDEGLPGGGGLDYGRFALPAAWVAIAAALLAFRVFRKPAPTQEEPRS